MLKESRRADKRQNREQPPLSSELPPPAPVDDGAFAQRAGEIIARASASFHKPTGRNKRTRGRG
jgi:hypothetical protein